MMWGGSRARVFVYEEPCDMRRSFSSLSGLVRKELKNDPLSGHYFFFMNRGKNYVKILFWDGTGFCLNAKKLPSGTFSSPKSKELLLQELMGLLEFPCPKASKNNSKKYRHIPE